MLTRTHEKRKFLPTLERFEPVVMDHTATKVYMECPRKYFYRIVLGRTLEKSNMKVIFDWGSAVHKFAELIYAGEGFQKAFTAALTIYTAPPPDGNSNWNHLDVMRLTETCKLLYEFYQKEEKDAATKIEGIEQPFNLTLPDSERIGGRFDQIITRNGRLLVRDWKTTTKQSSYFSMDLNPNDQATRYAYAASRLAGWDSKNPVKGKIDGIEFVVIENQKPTKSDRKPPKISTTFVSKTASDLITWENEQIFLYKQMEINRLHDVWPMHPVKCSWCDYVHVCRMPTDDSRAYKLKNDFKLKPWDHSNVDQLEKADVG